MLRKQFHNFLTLFNTTTLNNSKLFLFISFNSYSKVIKIGTLHLKKKKKKTPRTYKKTQREKAYTLFPDWHHRVKKKKEKKKKTSTATHFTVGRANGPIIFHDALTSLLLSFLSATIVSQLDRAKQRWKTSLLDPPYILAMNFGVVITQATTWNRDDLVIDREMLLFYPILSHHRSVEANRSLLKKKIVFHACKVEIPNHSGLQVFWIINTMQIERGLAINDKRWGRLLIGCVRWVDRIISRNMELTMSMVIERLYVRVYVRSVREDRSFFFQLLFCNFSSHVRRRS